MPLLRGRNFDTRDNADSTWSVIVSEKFAERLWPDESPIDQRIKFGDPSSTGDWMTLVGVVANAKYRTLVEDPTENPDDPDIFFSLSQYPIHDLGLLLRTSSPNPTGLAAALRREVQSLDSSVPIYAVAPMSQLVEQQTAGARFTALLMGLFGALALALATIGIYGIVSYSVTQRSREIGVRTALGAQRADVFRMVIGHALALTGVGIALGLAGALALTPLITSQLYGVSPTEPIVFVVMSLALLAAAGLASYLPARRATRVDPLVCLRYE